VTSTSANAVGLAWNASTPAAGCNLQGYKVFRNGTQVAAPTGTTYTDSGLTPGTTYNYTVAAIDTGNHVSGQSTAASGVTAADTTAPSVPANLRSTLKTASSVALAWDASTDNTGVKDYVIYRNGTQVGTSTTASFTDSALVPNTAYSFTVKARDLANNLSAASSALSVTTLSGTNANKGDLNTDNKVNLTDLAILLAHWQQAGVPITQGDVNSSGKVDLVDLAMLLSNWNKTL
jgi:cellulose 1,4-beta-cellobiosidase